MSLGASPKPSRPARPPPRDPAVEQQTSLCPAVVQQTSLHSAVAQSLPSVPTVEQSPVYLSVLCEELTEKLATPARSPPPVPRRPSPSREDQRSQIAQPENLNGHAESTGVRAAGDTLHGMKSDPTWVLYEDVRPDETDLAPQDCTTHQSPPPPRPLAPPRLAAPPRPAVVRPPRPSLPTWTSEDPAEHVYEYIPDVLSNTQLQDEGGTFSTPVPPAVPAEWRPQNVRSWSEQSSIDGDNSSKELQLLWEWWRNVEEWDQVAVYYQGEETKLLSSVVHRMKMAMRLFELLMFERGRVLLNYITELHCTADSVQRSSKTTRIMGMTGGTTGAVGAVAVIAGLALAPLTFGASVVAAGVGVGVAAAGGVTGASAAITNKVKSSQFRQKVERILRNYKSQMEDVVGCLAFIDVGKEHVRKRDKSKLKYMDGDAVKIVQMALERESFASTAAVVECACVLQAFASGLDSYFTEEDKLRLKKDSESQFAGEIREVAVRLKEGMDELIRIKNFFPLCSSVKCVIL